MTIQQEAYRLIDTLSDQSVQIVVEFIRNLPKEPIPEFASTAAQSRKAAAFARLQELREEFSACHPGSLEEERAAAMSEKYGFFEP